MTKNEEIFYSDPEVISGMKKLNKKRLLEISRLLEANFSVCVQYQTQVDYLIRFKANTGGIDKEIEKTIAKNGYQAIDACKRAFSLIDEVEMIFKQANLERSINKFVPLFYKDFNENLKIKDSMKKFKAMGGTDASLKCLRNDLGKVDYNILRIKGADGTLSGFIKLGKSILPDLQHLVDIINKEGLPTIMGGDEEDASKAVVTTVIVIGAIVIILSWFV